MPTTTTPPCHACGAPSTHRVIDVAAGTPTTRAYCPTHAPPEVREVTPLTPADEVAALRRQLARLDRLPPGPARPAQAAFIERLIADVEAGRRRLSDIPVDTGTDGR